MTIILLVWEIWRLRLNFFVVMMLSFLGGIGYTSTLSSFHQYITNPREEELNDTDLQGVVSFIITASTYDVVQYSNRSIVVYFGYRLHPQKYKRMPAKVSSSTRGYEEAV